MESNAPISAENLRQILHGNKIKARRIETVSGPTVTLYKIFPEAGTRISRVKALKDDISLAIQSASLRIVILDDCFGIELASFPREKVTLEPMLRSQQFTDARTEMVLPVIIGMNTYREPEIADLTELPHLLVAGATKQGKTTAIQGIMQSLQSGSKEKLGRIVVIDTKDVDNAQATLDEMKQEMEAGYGLLSASKCSSIAEYNRKYPENMMRYSVIIIDEYGDFAAGNSEREKRSLASILELAQKGRRAGIHIILATQRLSSKVISGMVKANFPARLAVRVPTKEDSRLILDADGAEKLLGSGDAIFSDGGRSVRVQIGDV